MKSASFQVLLIGIISIFLISGLSRFSSALESGGLIQGILFLEDLIRMMWHPLLMARYGTLLKV
jgi:hypothetical protein